MARSFLVASIFSVIILASCGPDVGSLNISGCIREHNAETKACLDRADQHLIACKQGDSLCQHDALSKSEDCLTQALDKIANCVEAAEKTLKE